MIRDQLQTNEKLTFTLNGVEVQPGQPIPAEAKPTEPTPPQEPPAPQS